MSEGAEQGGRRAMRCPDGILATCVVPWDEDGELLEEPFRRQVRVLAAELTPQLYVFGTGGEGYAVDDRSFREVAACFADEMARCGGRPMLGVISLSLRSVIERIELGRELGYREFQLSLPSWGALSDPELDSFFAETCGRFPDCRFLHYNLGRARRVLRGSDYLRLAAAHPNLVAVKFTSSDWEVLRELVRAAPPLRLFLTEYAFALLRDDHDVGLLASVLPVCPAKAHAFHAARRAELRALLEEVHAVSALMEAAIADPDVHIDGAYDKLTARVHVPGFPLRLLPPYRGADEAAFERFLAGLPASWRR
jgi:dihydrodipicolinate synthase/N-acetylneuraminate lyase